MDIISGASRYVHGFPIELVLKLFVVSTRYLRIVDGPLMVLCNSFLGWIIFR